MKFFELQLIASALGLTGGILMILKKKSGWLFSGLGIVIITYINYAIGLRVLIIPCLFSIVTTIIGYFKWGYDEKRNTIKEIK